MSLGTARFAFLDLQSLSHGRLIAYTFDLTLLANFFWRPVPIFCGLESHKIWRAKTKCIGLLIYYTAVSKETSFLFFLI